MRRILMSLLFLAVACGGGNSPTGPSNTGGGSNILSASIDGTAWSAASSAIATSSNTSVVPGGILFTGTTVVGTQARSLILSLDRIKGPGTYPLGVNTGTTAGGTLTMTFGSASWWSPLTGAAGSITIQSLTSSRVTGTFTATLVPLAGGTGTVQITNGRFDVPLNPGYAAPPADDEGSTVEATIGGVAFNGATVIGLGGGSSSVAITASTDAYIMTITASPLSGASSGPLSAGATPLREVRVQVAGSLSSWGGLAGDVGTLTITALTSTRVAGTFSGTLAPVGQGGAPLTVTNGRFDVRIGS